HLIYLLPPRPPRTTLCPYTTLFRSNKSNFKQGMSHEEALSHSLGYNGLADEEARSNYLESYTSLKDRPDYDGHLTLEEANKWYRSEEHTSELQSRFDIVCRLLLEQK